MKYPLKRFNIAVTGDFGHARTHEKMKQWTEHNGGEFSREISNKVTHLVCSKEHYKNAAPFGTLPYPRAWCGLLILFVHSPPSEAYTIYQDRKLRLAGGQLDESPPFT